MADIAGIRTRMQERMTERRALHENRLVDAFQEEIGEAEVSPATGVSHFLRRLNAGDDA